jgi:hypothetical protein
MEEEYKKLEETYGAEDAEYTGAQDQKLPSFKVELDDTYSCVLTEEERNSSTKRSENEDYQDMSAQVKAPMQAAYDAYLFDHPEAYWMGSPSITFSLSFTKLSDGSYTCKVVSPATVTTKQNYDGFITAISTYNSEVQTAVDEIKNSLEEDSTRQETVKAIHDYLCERLGYDSNYSSYTSDSL